MISYFGPNYLYNMFEYKSTGTVSVIRVMVKQCPNWTDNASGGSLPGSLITIIINSIILGQYMHAMLLITGAVTMHAPVSQSVGPYRAQVIESHRWWPD